MWPLVLLCALCALAEKCERHEAVEGCTVEDGHAHCEAWNMSVSIGGLPSCTTKITFSLVADLQSLGKDRYAFVCLEEAADFSHLSNLEELTIRTNRQNFSKFHLTADNVTCFPALQKLHLRVLRFQMRTSPWHIVEENAGLYAKFKSLHTFEITRGQKCGLNAIMHGLGPQLSMKILTLKNVQQFKSYGYSSAVNLTYFACGGNVEQLDLSYNDIVVVNVSDRCWSSKLLYLNLDHNLLAQTQPVKYFLVYAIPMLAGLQVVRASVAGAQYHAGLWDKPTDNHIVDISANNDTNTSPLDALSHLQSTPVGFFLSFDYWLNDLLNFCENITYIDIVTCAVANVNDNDAFLDCLDPNMKSYSCSSENFIAKVLCLFKNNCKYSCEQDIPFPVPPNLRVVSAPNFGKYADMTSDFISCNKSLQLSVHPNNNLQVWDMPSAQLGFIPKSLPRAFTLRGMHRMKYVNVQNHQFPFLLSRMNISDMRALEELHIGGGRVSEDDTLPRLSLETFTKLSVLNLSYSNLSGFEADVFLKHPHLSVLDLSHNQLTATSLSSLDLSHTGLTSLNLSHNKLTAIPSSLRQQLESMDGLELYLSENTFICNCENLAFLEWIQSDLPITLHYSGNHDCADSPGLSIHNIEVDSLHCDWYWKQPLILVFSTLTCVLLIVALATMYKKRFHIANLVFRLQERLCRDDGGASTVYTYDAFVVYSGSDPDRTWVHLVLQKTLENEFGFRLCIHYRNFTGGVDIAENIKAAIRHSRKVVLVMSKNFLQSDWCVDEVSMTTSVDRKKFVVIMYKDIMFSGVRIPAVVRHVIDTTTYIEWHEEPKEAEKLFWKRLRKALYNKHQMSHRLAGEQNPNLLLSEITDSTI